MTEQMAHIVYLIAGVLFIFSLAGLAKQETARTGNFCGIIGMAIAILVAMAMASGLHSLVYAAIALGAVLGAIVASRVAMDKMPELVAILHSFVGLAAVLVGFAQFLKGDNSEGVEHLIHQIETYVAIAIGAITFTGSIIAWGKLSATLSGKALTLPGRNLINLGMLVALVYCGVNFCQADTQADQLQWLYWNTAVACVLGVHLIVAIGGADMPVVVSMLNSYSGWAAASAGFMLSNNLLIITGALVGSSGAILSYIMCRGMNRSFANVIFGGIASTGGGGGSGESKGVEDCQVVQAAQVADLLRQASKVAIVPGYGMAVARAQHGVSRLTQKLRDEDTEVYFGIHEVAGRLPGHMNVLLAEADVPYDIVLGREEINPDLAEMDVVLVIGANDIVNPDALENPESPIAGMPQVEVWQSKTVVVFKRGMATGYAGVANPLFFKENTRMCFGDASDVVEEVLGALD